MFSKNLITKTLFATFSVMVAFTSCKKEDSVQTPPKPLQLTEFKSGDDITRFSYNTDGSLKTLFLSNDPISLDDDVTYTVSYLANKKINEFTGSNGTKIKLSYTNGLITKAEAFNGTIKYAETVYEYNGTVLKSGTISIVDQNNTVPYFKSDLTFNAAGNATRSNAFVFNPLTNQLEAAGYVLNQYDNKVNPFAALNDVILVFWQETSKNNVVKQEYFSNTGAAEEVVETTYTYNAQGYPVTAVMRETAPGQQPSTATISFKYQ
ncbi:MAG: hypothetical protein HEQ40_03755 [Lacibacter sp.]|jgi:hypothetical protein